MDTVNAVPVLSAIAGSGISCIGQTNTLTDSATGGVWTSSNSSIATINNTTGVVTGVAGGTVTISYTVGTSCSTTVTRAITVNATPAVAGIAGTDSVCAGSSITLTNITTGGTWASSDTTVASITSSGTATGIMAGTTTISLP